MRRAIDFFVTYAHANRRWADDFLKRLSEQLIPSKQYEYTLWRDTAILVGQLWQQEIHRALAECDLGLLLVSPAFLGSDYITREELPRFVGIGGKAVIPVMLQRVDFTRHDLKGLEAHQVFRLEGRDGPRAYARCRDDISRRRYVELLFLQIERRLDRLLGAPVAIVGKRGSGQKQDT